MTFLFVLKQKKNLDTFRGVVAGLLAAGHRVTLAIQQRDAERDQRLREQFGSPLLDIVAPPGGRGDRWRAAAPLLRSARDLAQYTRPAYALASKLRQRAASRLLDELGATGTLETGALALPAAAGERLRSALDLLERGIPSDPLHEEFLTRHAPDVVLITPGVHFGSVQTDVVKSANARGIPVWMLLFSWDNLSTKGALHAPPDLLFVWNERQRREAAELHGYPPDRVVVVGAPRFDEFFALRPRVDRRDFLTPLGLDASKPALLYLCSSRFIADRELPFIGRWLRAVREGPDPLRTCNVIVRPHPDVALVEDGPEAEAVTWPGMPPATGWVQRPFDDRGAIVLRTANATLQAFYECLHHAGAVVGLNTSAELEAGIAGRPVLTLLTRDTGVDGQAGTLHFDYLLREHGGFVICAQEMSQHIAALNEALVRRPDAARIQAFVAAFLRPHGDRPVAELLARTLVERATTGAAPVNRPATATPPLKEEQLDAPAISKKLLRLDVPGSTLRVHATPETKRWRRHGVLRLDPAVVAWLSEHMHPGEVFYDVGAGVGAYALLAAAERGGLAFAFEPGFAAFSRLCENILLNGCAQSVVPLPTALSDRPGLVELAYPRAPGEDVHTLRAEPWRPRPDRPDPRYSQPVAADRLDEIAARHDLPPPHVLRVAVRGAADRVLQGATRLLSQSPLRSVLVSVTNATHVAPIERAARDFGFASELSSPNGDFAQVLRLTRTGDAVRGRGRPRRVSGTW